MYQIYILMALAAILAMALGGRRRYRRYMAGKIDHKLQLGTLAGQVVLGSLIADDVDDTTWVSSVKAAYSIGQYTPVAECGPFIYGWAHSDYTDAEVEEWVEQADSWKEGNKVAQEQSRRKIRQVGTFETLPVNAQQTVAAADGRNVTTKLGWMLAPGQTLRFWVYNAGTAAVATTDPEVRAQGHANLWPK